MNFCVALMLCYLVFASYEARASEDKPYDAKQLSRSAADVDAKSLQSPRLSPYPKVSNVQSQPELELAVSGVIVPNQYAPQVWGRPAHLSDSEWMSIVKGVSQASNITGLPHRLIYSLIDAESSFKGEVVSKSGAIGLTQVKPTTAKAECGLEEKELYDAQKNIVCGTQYLSKQLNTFRSLDLAIAAYNAGPGAVTRASQKAQSRDLQAVTAHLNPNTAKYVRKVLQRINYGSDCI